MADANDGDTVVATDRLVIRPWRLDEADRFFDIYRRTEVVRWFGLAATPMRDRREAVERIGRISAQLAADPRLGRWAVVERSSEAPIGTVVLQPLPNGDGEIEIGWHLHPDWWGRGYATEAARALLKRGLADGLREVWALTHLSNRRSIAVCRRLEMQLLGITQRWYHEPSLMFWAGACPGQEPSLEPDEPAPAELIGG